MLYLYYAGVSTKAERLIATFNLGSQSLTYLPVVRTKRNVQQATPEHCYDAATPLILSKETDCKGIGMVMLFLLWSRRFSDNYKA